MRCQRTDVLLVYTTGTRVGRSYRQVPIVENSIDARRFWSEYVAMRRPGM
jgi:hypothetical protein